MNRISIFEVGPRDGLQNDPRSVSASNKIKWITDLVNAGIQNIELAAFVRNDRVPAMGDSEEVLTRIQKSNISKRMTAWSLVPNQKGLERAIESGAKAIGLFTAASETFNQKNVGMSIKQSLEEFKCIAAIAKKEKVRIRGYVSMAFGCPFEGVIKPKQVMPVIEKLIDLGCEQVSIGDTIGVASAVEVTKLITQALNSWKPRQIAMHFHDTRGTAMANAWVSYHEGIQTFDSSAGGLGGCPFAPGATGNVATEDLVYFFERSGIKTGIDFDRLCRANLDFEKKLNGTNFPSRALRAFAASKVMRK